MLRSRNHRAGAGTGSSQEVLAFAGQDGLGVELHALDAVAAVAQAHDDAVARAGGNLELLPGKTFRRDHQRVIAPGREARRQAAENRPTVVEDFAGLDRKSTRLNSSHGYISY